MTDSTLNRFLSRGTNAQRLAFTPAPPTPSSGPSPTYVWFETDTLDTYAYDGSAWNKVNNSSGSVTATGSPASGNLTKFSGAASVTNGDLSGDVTTSGTLAATIANNAVTTAKINNSAVTLAKIANAAANSKLVGSGAAGSGAAYAELTLGTNLSMSGTTLNAAGGGWSLAATNTIASSVTSVDFTGLSGTDIMIVCRNVVQAVSGVLACRVSVDNGTSYFSTSGDYISLTTAGVESNSAFGPGFHLTSSTAARTGVVQMPGAGVNGGVKPMTSALSPADTRLFIASTSPINAVRVFGSAGNMTAGTIYVFTR